MTRQERIQDRAIDYGDNVQDYRSHPPVGIIVFVLAVLVAIIFAVTTITLQIVHKLNQTQNDTMTTLELTQATARALDQAINLIISENKIDEALQRLNEARICTEQMEKMINPPKMKRPEPTTTLRKEICNAFGINESDIFKKTRKREIVNARQVFVFCISEFEIYGKKNAGCSKVKRLIGWDHSTHLHSVKVVSGYYDTEPMYKALLPRLKEGLANGSIAVDELPIAYPEFEFPVLVLQK